MDPRFQLALISVKAEMQARPDVVALLFFGSLQRGDATGGSDVDLYAITSGSETWVEGRWVAETEVELHFGPVRAWQQRIEASQPVVTHAFASGELLFDRTGEAAVLKRKAEERWSEGPPAPTASEADRLRYHLSDMARDLEHMPADGIEARMLSGRLVPSAIEAWCAFRRVWPGKPGVMLQNLRRHAPLLAEKVERFYRAPTSADAVGIADDVLELVGGRIREYSTPRRAV